MPNLSKRNRLPEWMDQPDIDPALHLHALQGLARLNYFSNSVNLLWKPLRKLAQANPHSGDFSVLDVATGSGDIPLALNQKARKAGINMNFSVTDKSSFALNLVKEKALQKNSQVQCFETDALHGPDFPVHDVVICSLFMHHLDDDEAISLMKRMAKAAKIAILINDLERSWLNWNMVWIASHLLTTSPVVHMDGPRSVAGAFNQAEVAKLAKQAGLLGATIETRWPCRFLLSWNK
ncbi:MAG: methyltransferase domain-containing protein [Planctomycetes bacterium]|nr:methyltransferase domain-containing protein [Planctomycetota bacterium]